MRLAEFRAARERMLGLRNALVQPHRWSGEDRPQPQWFNRETYLVPEWPMSEAPSPDGSLFASLRERELYVRPAGSDAGRFLTSGAAEDTGWDIETAGVSPWSPDGRWLYACAVDRSEVFKSVRTRFAADGGVGVDFPRSQRAGTPLDRMRPHIVPLDGGAPRPIDIGDTSDAYLRLVGWLPDGRLVVTRFSRLLDRAELLLVDATSGSARTVLDERSATPLRPSTIVWVEPVGCVLLSGDRFLWLSPRDGYQGLYLGSFDDPALRPLATAPMVVRDILRADADFAWFRAGIDGERPYDVHLFRVALASGPVERLSEGDGVHDIAPAPDGARLLDSWSTPSLPPTTLIRRADGEPLATPETLDMSAWLGDRWRPPEEVMVAAADGATALHGLLYLPAHGVASGRLPLVHWLYGGPQIASVNHRFGPRDDTQVLLHTLAATGYAVFVVDNRGTPGRSRAFQDVVQGSFAPHVVADQVGALRQLLDAHPEIDRGRIGVMGRSWGAHFALRLMADAPDLYRAGVLVVPGLDPYGGVIYEPYLGLPQQNVAPYEAAEPWSEVQRLSADARLLLMAGTLDSPCQWDMQRLSRLLVERDIAHHCLAFAEEEHMFLGAAQRFHDRSVFEFFEAALA